MYYTYIHSPNIAVLILHVLILYIHDSNAKKRSFKSNHLCFHPQFSASVCIYHIDINTYSPTIAVLALDFFLLYVWNSQREYLENE